jgi:hypothetical protein
VGFSQVRGDSVKVINAPFKVLAPAPGTDAAEGWPLWPSPQVLAMVRTLAVPLVLGLALVFGVIRPVLRVLWLGKAVGRPAAPIARLDAAIDEVPDLPSVVVPQAASSESDLCLAAVRGAADVLRHLTSREVQCLGEAMARTRSIARVRYERVLVRFESQVVADAQGLIEFGLDTGDSVRNVLYRALGQDKARLLAGGGRAAASLGAASGPPPKCSTSWTRGPRPPCSTTSAAPTRVTSGAGDDRRR